MFLLPLKVFFSFCASVTLYPVSVHITMLLSQKGSFYLASASLHGSMAWPTCFYEGVFGKPMVKLALWKLTQPTVSLLLLRRSILLNFLCLLIVKWMLLQEIWKYTFSSGANKREKRNIIVWGTPFFYFRAMFWFIPRKTDLYSTEALTHLSYTGIPG